MGLRRIACGRSVSRPAGAFSPRGLLRVSRNERRGSRSLAVILLLCAILARGSEAGGTITTIADPEPIGAPTAVAPIAGWSATALRTAGDLARRIAASGIGCAEYAPSSFELLADDMKQRGLPVPAAMSQCLAADGEDLTFEVFADEEHAEQFLAAKLALLCQAAAKAKIALAFTYVDGPAWIVEPDAQATASELARLLGATSRQRPCSEFR